MIRCSWLLLWSVFLANPAKADSKRCDPKDPKSCVQYVSEGERVPFAGQLLTLRRAAIVTSKLERCEVAMSLALEEAQELASIDLELEKKLRANDKHFWSLEKKLLQESLERARARGWTESPALWAIVGSAATVAALIGAVQVIDATR